MVILQIDKNDFKMKRIRRISKLAGLTVVMLLLLACSESTTADIPASEEPDALEEPDFPDLPTVNVKTVDGEALTFDYVTAPPGCLGQGITNAKKVCGRMTIRQHGKTLYDSGDYEEDKSGMRIKVRGNSSAWEPKKPYKIDLELPVDLLFGDDEQKYRDREWLLVRDWQASPYMLIGTTVNEMLGLQWTPRFRYVNLVLNGEYMGLYALVESVKRSTRSRLNVGRYGYVIELDAYWWNEDVWFETLLTEEPSMKYTFKYPDPEKIKPERIDYIRDYVNSFDDGLFYKNHFAEYIDSTSFAAWLLGQDILGSYDANGTNIFITKYDDTPETKLMMGCLWDFDYIMMTPGRWSGSHNLSYFVRLLNNGRDRSFANAYRAKWNEVKDSLYDTIRQRLEAFAASEEGEAYERAMIRDMQRWGWHPTPLKPLIDQAIAWFEERRVWLDKAIEEATQ